MSVNKAAGAGNLEVLSATHHRSEVGETGRMSLAGRCLDVMLKTTGKKALEEIVGSFQRLGKLDEVKAFAASIANDEIKNLILLELVFTLDEAGETEKAIKVLESINRTFLESRTEHLPVNKRDVLITMMKTSNKFSNGTILGIYLNQYTALESLENHQRMEAVIKNMKELNQLFESSDRQLFSIHIIRWTFDLFEKYRNENNIGAALRVAKLFEVSEDEAMSQTFEDLSQVEGFLNEGNIVKAVIVAAVGTLKSPKDKEFVSYWDGILDLIDCGRISVEVVELVGEIIGAFPQDLNGRTGTEIADLKEEFDAAKDVWIKKHGDAGAAGAGEAVAQGEILEHLQALREFVHNG